MLERELLDRVRYRMASGESGDLGGAVRAETTVLADDLALAELERGVAAELSGAGPLDGLLALPGVTDVLVNSATEVWLDRGRGLERAPVRFPDDAAVRRLAQRLAGAVGRRLDDATPFVDASLPDGTRLHAVLPPLTEHPTVSLRVLGRRGRSLVELVPPPVAELLQAVIRARLGLVISGGTGVGKTTLLGALLGLVPVRERIVTVEDARELAIAHPHVVRLAAREPNVEGAGAVGLRQLVRQALRMRPDRLVVGEFRGAEMVELLVALNTGHEGGAATLHANSVEDVPGRLAALGGLAGLPAEAVASQVRSALDVAVHLRRGAGGSRQVVAVGVFVAAGREVTVQPVWTAETGALPAAGRLRERLASRQITVPRLLLPPSVLLPVSLVPTAVVPTAVVPAAVVPADSGAPGTMP